jgi:replication-associated recombination protein RarA
MNGPVILDNVRQLLADEIFAYHEPKPAQLKISPWLAMSLLQKAIRRGESDLAQFAAATLFLIAPDRLWRRCGAAAFEEIGVADLQTVSLATAALAGKRYRATIGGDWKVASFIVDRMAKAPKCRAADDLLLTGDSHPLYRRARSDLSTKTTRELI